MMTINVVHVDLFEILEELRILREESQEFSIESRVVAMAGQKPSRKDIQVPVELETIILVNAANSLRYQSKYSAPE